MTIKLITGLESVNWHELAVVFERTPLHSAPGKEGFYECLGYRGMKTAMALFANPERAQELKYIE